MWTCAVAHGGDWLAGPVDALDARVKGPEWAGRGGGQSQVFRPGSPLSSSSHPLRGHRVRDRWEEGNTAALFPPSPERRCDRGHEERSLRLGGARSGESSNPQTSRTPSLGAGTGAHEWLTEHSVVRTEKDETRALAAELAEGGWRRQALAGRGHLGGALAGQVRRLRGRPGRGRKRVRDLGSSWAAPDGAMGSSRTLRSGLWTSFLTMSIRRTWPDRSS